MNVVFRPSLKSIYSKTTAKGCQRAGRDTRELEQLDRVGHTAPVDAHLMDGMAAKKPLNLEKSLAELETLVDDLENGDLPLDKAMKKFEEGIKLSRSCQAALKDAEQKVQILIESAGEQTLEPFDPGDD